MARPPLWAPWRRSRCRLPGLIKLYHAPINAGDIPAIVDYLVKTKGTP